MRLNELNNASPPAARELLRQCCSSDRWLDKLLDARPFSDEHALAAAADKAWRDMAESDYLQAFDGHPKIGDVDSLKAKYGNSKQLAAAEQAAMNQAAEEVVTALAQGNRDYQQKFGFIFIVCATGKSAQQMLALLQARLPNSREVELRNAAEEQRKILQLRLEKLP